MELSQVINEAEQFATRLKAVKDSRPDVRWYPFRSLANFRLFDNFTGPGRDVFSFVGPGQKVADIGAADGDVAFFLEELGTNVTIIDNVSTNANNCRGILELQSMLNSKARIHLTDIDWVSWLPGQYDLVLFLGILYHVRNPILILNTIAHCASHLLMSTKIFFRLEEGIDVETRQIAYLAERREINNDPTNYWLLTPQALRLLLRRSGWKVLDEFFTGNTKAVTPREGDARMFCYCERLPNWQQLRNHHDF